MGRGTRHYEKPQPSCPACRGQELVVMGPVEEIKGMAHVPVGCGGCQRTWKSQNAVLVARVEGSA